MIPNDSDKMELPAYLKGLEGGIPRGKMITFVSQPRDPSHDWMRTMRRILTEGLPIISPLEIPSVRYESLKGRPLDEMSRFALDYSAPMKFTDLAWRPGDAEQAIGRVLRKRYRSRNEREGVYNFKVKGRHTRKHRPLKIVMVELDSCPKWALEEDTQ